MIENAQSAQWILLETFLNRHEGELQKGRLESEGIPVLLLVDDAGGAYPSLTSLLGARLHVQSQDLERAKAVLGG